VITLSGFDCICILSTQIDATAADADDGGIFQERLKREKENVHNQVDRGGGEGNDSASAEWR
jgi:hypothetical protein